MQQKKLSILIQISAGFLLIHLASPSLANPVVSAKNTKITKEININQANVKTLSALAGIGKKTAAAIVDHRNKKGRFQSLNELTKVRGINKNTLQRIEQKNHARIIVQKKPVAH